MRGKKAKQIRKMMKEQFGMDWKVFKRQYRHAKKVAVQFPSMKSIMEEVKK